MKDRTTEQRERSAKLIAKSQELREECSRAFKRSSTACKTARKLRQESREARRRLAASGE